MTGAQQIVDGRKMPQVLALAAILACASFGQTATSGDQDEAEWNRIRTTKLEAELLAYIEKYPTSKFANFASRRIDELEWEKVDKTNVAAVKDFLRRYPDLQLEIPAAMQARLSAPPQEDAAQPAERTGASRSIDGIEKTLRDLTVAYGSRNIEAVRSVWPSLPQNLMKKTQQVFKEASSVALKLETTSSATIEGDTAIAICRRSLELMNDGRPSIVNSLVSIKMRRVGQQWLIESIQ
jgi:hypothetical protein